jgi:hypothetical protein
LSLGPETAYAECPTARCHDNVIAGPGEGDMARRFATQRVTRFPTASESDRSLDGHKDALSP